jgi:hypothetical protein
MGHDVHYYLEFPYATHYPQPMHEIPLLAIHSGAYRSVASPRDEMSNDHKLLFNNIQGLKSTTVYTLYDPRQHLDIFYWALNGREISSARIYAKYNGAIQGSLDIFKFTVSFAKHYVDQSFVGSWMNPIPVFVTTLHSNNMVI